MKSLNKIKINFFICLLLLKVMYKNFIILLILIIIIIIVKRNNKECLISLDKYKELKILENNKEIIINELKNILNKKWISYDSIHKDKYDYFSQVKEENVFKKFKSLETNLNYDKLNPGWKTYVLIFNGKITSYSKGFENTMSILKKIPGVKHAGFSCFEPGAISDYHTDNNFDTYRYHLPLIIPKGDCKFKLLNKYYTFNNPIIFDDSCKHQVWNNTKDNRIILIIDIYRKDFNI